MAFIQFSDWKVVGTLPYQADFSKHMQEGLLLPNLTPFIPASVPGCIYQDLYNAGLLPDPYFGENSLSCEWVASRWWIYRTTFRVSEEEKKDFLKLKFEGIDYSAQIYLNGHRLARHEGMYLSCEKIINDYVKTDEENILVCILEHAPFADPQPGYTSKTRYLKARFNYKWDFAVRLVSLGLYEKVTLTRHSLACVSHYFIRPVKTEDGWKIDLELELTGYKEGKAKISYALEYPTKEAILCQGEEEIDIKAGFLKYKTSFAVANPELWWPNGYGEQTLYPFHLRIFDDETLTDEFSSKVGFRTLSYHHADGRKDALPYQVSINGKKIYLKGTNMVPVDCMTGRVSFEELREKLKAAQEANINYLRIWGGGHIESEDYYSLCDELGLMILQEFPMSSSGCDDVPSKNAEFLKLLEKSARENMKKKRNHVSLILWDGGNELTDERYMDTDDHEGHPASFEDATLAMLKGLAAELCPDIMMLPSSGSGPNALLKEGDTGNNHDVHGPWGYMGVEAHYQLYNQSDSIVHGEFGCGGMSNYESICRFTEEKDRHLYTSEENSVWAHHSGGWDSYSFREQLMFGDLRGIPFTDYIKVSQFVQAESLRYSLEANRRRQWKNVGQMTWQFNEPWPNMQCSNVIDYYGSKKLAYYFLKDAYKSVLTSLKYDKLFYQSGEQFTAEIHLINDTKDAPYQIDYEILTANGQSLLKGTETGTAKEDLSQKVAVLSAALPQNLTGGFSVLLHTKCGAFEGKKEYLMLIADQEKSVHFSELEKRKIDAFHITRFVNPVNGKRADPQTVIEYVDRCWESISKN